MQKRFEFGETAQEQPIWLRQMAVLCLMLICIVSTAQVCHTHADFSSTTKDSRQNSPGPDHCPLCVAMHSALPATASTAPQPVLEVDAVLYAAVEMQYFQRWSFELFSRPPPIVRLIA